MARQHIGIALLRQFDRGRVRYDFQRNIFLARDKAGRGNLGAHAAVDDFLEQGRSLFLGGEIRLMRVAFGLHRHADADFRIAGFRIQNEVDAGDDADLDAIDLNR